MSSEPKKSGSKIFILAFVAFLAVMILLVADMASRTTAPWNRPKIEQVLPDSSQPDSLFLPDSL
jgi:hypothetical protein